MYVCWVQITQELRDYAQKHQIDEEQAAEVSTHLSFCTTSPLISLCLWVRTIPNVLSLHLTRGLYAKSVVQANLMRQQLKMLSDPALNAAQAGMAQMSEQFKSVGAEVYLDEATVEVNA